MPTTLTCPLRRPSESGGLWFSCSAAEGIPWVEAWGGGTLTLASPPDLPIKLYGPKEDGRWVSYFSPWRWAWPWHCLGLLFGFHLNRVHHVPGKEREGSYKL